MICTYFKAETLNFLSEYYLHIYVFIFGPFLVIIFSMPFQEPGKCSYTLKIVFNNCHQRCCFTISAGRVSRFTLNGQLRQTEGLQICSPKSKTSPGMAQFTNFCFYPPLCDQEKPRHPSPWCQPPVTHQLLSPQQGGLSLF